MSVWAMLKLFINKDLGSSWIRHATLHITCNVLIPCELVVIISAFHVVVVVGKICSKLVEGFVDTMFIFHLHGQLNNINVSVVNRVIVIRTNNFSMTFCANCTILAVWQWLHNFPSASVKMPTCLWVCSMSDVSRVSVVLLPIIYSHIRDAVNFLMWLCSAALDTGRERHVPNTQHTGRTGVCACPPPPRWLSETHIQSHTITHNPEKKIHPYTHTCGCGWRSLLMEYLG